MPGKSKLSNPLTKPKPEIKFDLEVEDAQKKIEFFNQEMPRLAQEFFNILNNKTLTGNKGPSEKNYETQIFNQISSLAEKMNLDETQVDSAGSMALNIMTMIALRDLRDRINFLEFDCLSKIKNLEKKFSDLEKQKNDQK